MKKILILFVLTISSISFATNGVDYSNTNFYLYENNDYGVSAVAMYSCTATVTYNGVYRTSFTYYSATYSGLAIACALARGDADAYIKSQQLAVFYSLEEFLGERANPGEEEPSIFD
ncbi:hypothetical protein [Mariniflexile maritimum]|jgi:hypothetical protein|uniref:hypothetical protein n=1 Tax=Mariniflexile maritimum TaxID=2682493 RepID=UPI0012F649BE|nr:hypothetical protein [Mariniflexile maritimum]